MVAPKRWQASDTACVDLPNATCAKTTHAPPVHRSPRRQISRIPGRLRPRRSRWPSRPPDRRRWPRTSRRRKPNAGARWGGMELSAIPGVAAWRAAYKGFGIKRTSYRSSVERLIKRVLAGQPLPEINALVDLYNMVVAESGLCLGCDDLDKTEGDLVFRFSRPGDSFHRHGRGGRARTRTIRRRKARSSTPTRATCSAGGGTGGRTRRTASSRR